MTVSKKADKSLDLCCTMKTQEQQRCSSSPNLKPQESGEPAVNILDQKLVGLRCTKNGELSRKRLIGQPENKEEGLLSSLLPLSQSLFS